MSFKSNNCRFHAVFLQRSKNRPPSKQAQGGRKSRSGCGRGQSFNQKKCRHGSATAGDLGQSLADESGCVFSRRNLPTRIVAVCVAVCKNLMWRFVWKAAPVLALSQVVTRHFFCAFLAVFDRFCRCPVCMQGGFCAHDL